MNFDETFQTALAHHRAGRLDEAELLYRQILAVHVNHADSLHMLGMLCYQTGRIESARQSIAHFVALKPEAADGYANLGLVLQARGEPEHAVKCYRKAIELSPREPEFHNRLGVVLRIQGKFEEAVASFNQAIELDPASSAAHNNLGNAFTAQRRRQEAMAAYRKAVSLQPDNIEAANNLANTLREAGALGEAIALYRHALQLQPEHAEVLAHLGTALDEAGELPDAIACYRRFLAIKPNATDISIRLGNALVKIGAPAEAMSLYSQATSLEPASAVAHFNLGCAQLLIGKPDDAIASFRQTLLLEPKFAAAANNLGSALRDAGRLDEAIEAYRQALIIEPDYREAADNIVYAQLFHPDIDQRQQTDELKRWRDSFAKLKDRQPSPSPGTLGEGRGEGELAEPKSSVLESALTPTLSQSTGRGGKSSGGERADNATATQAIPEDRDVNTTLGAPAARIRIGYVSPDFRDHVVGRNVLPILRHHDRNHFEILCYSNVQRPDAMTAQFKSAVDHWRDIASLSDGQAADLIRGDGIDILIDLALHMAFNRLPVFARRPAPVQMTWAGYPGTTGLEAIDYRISDPYLDPPGLNAELYNTERTIHLPHSFWCYDPLGMDVPVNPLPAGNSGAITFGCLNSFHKLNAPTLQLWADLLRAVPGSALRLLAPEGSARAAVLDALAARKIDASRIHFHGVQPRREYLQRYHQIDIALDSFPYNGHTTSLDALWMGVPLITVAGNSPVSRAGVSQLSNLGLTELIAGSPAEFVEIGVSLASDREKLASLRASLRGRLEQSPIMDAAGFTASFESAVALVARVARASSPC